MKARIFRRTIAATVAAVVPCAVLTLTSGSAQATTGNPDAPETLPATASSQWQTNNSVWALAYSNHVLYAGGDFTAIVSPDGNTSIPMTRLAAFHANEDNPALDGTPCTAASPCQGIGAWSDKKISARVWALSVTLDGTKLYAGGDFTSAANASHKKVAGFNLAVSDTQPALPTPQITGQVRALAATNDAVFAGGGLSSLVDPNGGTVTQAKAASFDTSDGSVRNWHPTLDGNVFALLVGPGSDAGNLILGGAFRKVNGAAHSGIAQVDLATGKVNGPMSNSIIPGIATNPTTGTTTRSDVKALTTDGTKVYLGAEGTGYGIFDGTVAVNPVNGSLVWKDNCLGATQGVAVLNGVVYVGSHSHNCSFLQRGGFPQLPFNGDNRSWHHLIAETAAADGTHINGELLNWFPNTDAGPAAGALGPRAVVTDGTNVYVGGEFTTVNGVNQRGITRFSSATDTTSPTAPVLTATSPAAGKATVRFTGSSDLDDKYLTYTIVRDGSVTVPGSSVIPNISTPQDSPFWQSPVYTVREAGLTPGDHTYVVTATDAAGLQSSGSVTVNVVSAGYTAQVLADSPAFYWKLNETSGTTAKDSSGHNSNGTYLGSATVNNQPGAVIRDSTSGTDPDAAAALNHPTSRVSSKAAPALAPANYSIEMWFRTDPTNRGGGRIIGYSNAATGSSSTPNRLVYMMNSGQLIYLIFTSDASTCHNGTTYGQPHTCYVWSKQAYNDGTWHHVVATQSATGGMALYVDGALVGDSSDAPALKPKSTKGVWRVGNDVLTGAAQKPSNGPLAGDVDEIAVYNYVLTPAQILAHWRAAG